MFNVLPGFDSLRRKCRGPVRAIVTVVHALRIEPVPHAADVQKESGLRGIGLQLPAQTDDVVVDDAVVEADVPAPGSIEQLFARQYSAPALHESRQQLEL